LSSETLGPTVKEGGKDSRKSELKENRLPAGRINLSLITPRGISYFPQSGGGQSKDDGGRWLETAFGSTGEVNGQGGRGSHVSPGGQLNKELRQLWEGP